jgi:excisionase family DNA binding protein
MNGQRSSTLIRESDIDLIESPASALLPTINRVLTVAEVARELRCSKAHVHNLINGRVSGVKPLPAIPLGRRRIVRRESLNDWIASNERHLA